MKTSSLFLSMLCIWAFSAEAQVVCGTLKDGETDQPVPGAHIYIGNSKAGVVSDPDGKFCLVAGYSAELIFSHIGYLTFTYQAKVGRDTLWLDVTLTPLSEELEQVNVEGEEDRRWRRQLKRFQKAFLGYSANAKGCEIINPWVLDFKKEGDVVVAKAADLLEIKNRDLGYKMKLFMKHFLQKGDAISYSGVPVFEELQEYPPQKVQLAREKAFNGSFRHFLMAIAFGKAEEDGFLAYEIKPNKELSAYRTLSSVVFEKQITAEGENVRVQCPPWLQVYYTHEAEENAYIPNVPPSRLGPRISDSFQGQTSYLHVPDSTLLINPSTGELLNPEKVQQFGYWSFERAAELLPFEYLPQSFLKEVLLR